MEFGERLTRLLQKRFPGAGWQSDAARRIWGEDRVGSMQPQISRWCGGKSNPNPTNLAELADFLGVRLRYLMTGDFPVSDAEAPLEAVAFREIAAVVDRVRGDHTKSRVSDAEHRAAVDEAEKRAVDGKKGRRKAK